MVASIGVGVHAGSWRVDGQAKRSGAQLCRLRYSLAMGRASVPGVFALGLLAGCRAHVQLPSADANGAESVRMYEYRTYRPQNARRITVSEYQHGRFVGGYSFLEGVTLANGSFVHHAEDLIPLAGEDSPTAESARAALASARVADALVGTGLGALVLGLALIPCALACGPRGPAEPSIPLFVTVGVLGVGGIITAAASAGPRWTAQRRREHAYDTFDGSFLRNLRLCGPGAPLGPCPPVAPFNPPAWSANITTARHRTTRRHPTRWTLEPRRDERSPGTSQPRGRSRER